jgi:hypothetical protein
MRAVDRDFGAIVHTVDCIDVRGVVAVRGQPRKY